MRIDWINVYTKLSGSDPELVLVDLGVQQVAEDAVLGLICAGLAFQVQR